MSGGLADSVIARIAKQGELIRAMHEQCQSMRVRVTNRDQTVSVEVDGLAAMTGLWFSQSAYRNGADVLADQIVVTAGAAAKVAADRQQYLLEQLSEQMSALKRTPLSGSTDSTLIQGPPTESDTTVM